MRPGAPQLIERIVADLGRRPAPRSTADLAREYLGLGLLDERTAETLLGPVLSGDPRLHRSAAGWTLRDGPASLRDGPAALRDGPASSYEASPPLSAPHVACLAPRDLPAAVVVGDPGDAAYTVACGGEAEALRAGERTGVRLPRPVVDLALCARRLRAYRGPADPLRLAESLRVPHLDPAQDGDDPAAHARVALAVWQHLAGELAEEGVVDLAGLARLLQERLEEADLAGRGFGLGDLAALSPGPGAYLFRDARRRVLYVGQSRNLAARVASYFAGPPRDEKDRVLRAEAHALETRAVDSDPDALLLEARWIERFRPRLNTRLVVRAAATEDGVLAVRGGAEGNRVVFFVLRAPGLAGRFACADTPKRRAAVARQAAARLFAPLPVPPSTPAPAPAPAHGAVPPGGRPKGRPYTRPVARVASLDREAGALVDAWRRAHPEELFLRPAIDGGEEQILARLLRDP